ncbi:MAG: hypothetical protein VX793_13785 [Pseudomonadota bacterium]|nr:hypothetical protein [Pseudomonadota bacterium]
MTIYFWRLFFIGTGLLVCVGGGKYLAEDFVYLVSEVLLLDIFDHLIPFLLLDLGVSTVFYGLGGVIVGYANVFTARLDGALLALGYGGVTGYLRYVAETGWPVWYEVAVVVMILAGVMVGVEIGRRLYLNAHSEFFNR